ncbi:MAG: choice-of-anchor I family protein [Deltaproteobacteria bacterium]|nr:choice-of-anchor I family protein [Deltaproteobacteria bacterium]
MLFFIAATASALTLDPIGSWSSGVFDDGASEIAAFDPASDRLFLVNASTSTIDILDLSNPSNPTYVSSIALAGLGGQANSVVVRNGVLAAAIEAVVKQDPGVVAFFDTNGVLISSVTVGALPDMLTFTPNGDRMLVANEGEPSDSYLVDPEGSVSIIDLRNGAAAVTNADVTTVGFGSWALGDLDASTRVYGPGATVAQDLEPEYIAVSHDSRTAWVTLQEANTVAILDIASGVVTDLVGLGFKDWSSSGFDSSDRDSAINILSRPVFGMYQPDAIGAIHHKGDTFLITANEGDARAYTGFSEEVRVSTLTLDPTAFPDGAALKTASQLGRLRVTSAHGDTDGDGDFDVLYAYGARSISVRSETGELLWDGGDELEQLVASEHPANFNANHEDNAFDGRSDDKGPEPEGLAVAKLWGDWYAFVGLERISGIAVYDLSDPTAPTIDSYVNTRNFAGVPESGTAGDLGPEGVLVISAEDAPNGVPLLVVAYEVSGSVGVFEIQR